MTRSSSLLITLLAINIGAHKYFIAKLTLKKIKEDDVFIIAFTNIVFTSTYRSYFKSSTQEP